MIKAIFHRPRRICRIEPMFIAAFQLLGFARNTLGEREAGRVPIRVSRGDESSPFS
jgi:hypothetical protein